MAEHQAEERSGPVGDLTFEELPFGDIPFEDLPVDELGLVELESRMEAEAQGVRNVTVVQTIVSGEW
ncbi:hypothetical protein I3F58_18865 [Streptomyces sp. MUM 203J]|uniref:hypothetical protein n=1 Tax=Streptomyces sp. MUM 203J TaxID=2791990 RepID=UPI001F03A80B|nr:hypothetical protein [Streptomyces sp. MUM 203J]MCH0541585.1 hypothetical protein [Streptomyces sp. MUM 203J]